MRGAASSTSELVCDIARALGLHFPPQAAAALYAGISFDTGHFHHDSTAPSTFRTAAWLVELGVDVTGMYALLYESRSQASLRLWARAVAGATAVAGGRALLAGVTTDDLAAHRRGTRGDRRHRRQPARRRRRRGGRPRQGTDRRRGVRVSLRSETIDVSAIAALQGGGGHKLAAGFSSDDRPEEVIAWLSSELERRLSTASS